MQLRGVFQPRRSLLLRRALDMRCARRPKHQQDDEQAGRNAGGGQQERDLVPASERARQGAPCATSDFAWSVEIVPKAASPTDAPICIDRLPNPDARPASAAGTSDIEMV